MHRKPLLDLLQSYQLEDEEENRIQSQMFEFINQHPDCFERSCTMGHITVSAWILNVTGDKFLLTLHKKLKKWLPLGGHADGDTDVLHVSLKEAQEESGLQSLAFVSKEIFDVSIHDFVTPTIPLHQHYDFNFLMQVQDSSDKIHLSDESLDLQWFEHLPENCGMIERLFQKYQKRKSSKLFSQKNTTTLSIKKISVRS